MGVVVHTEMHLVVFAWLTISTMLQSSCWLQIRVHLADAGHAIIGDEVYGVQVTPSVM